MNISIFGLGYVGCVGIGCLSSNGHNVIGVDINQSKVDAINEGKSPIVENKIEDLLSRQHGLDRIKASTDGIDAVKATEVSFICVGTPSTGNGHLNLNAIFKVAAEIGKGINRKDTFHTVVIRSTVLPGTNEKVAQIIAEESAKANDHDFAVVSNPEFLREGTAVDDYFSPAYTLIGSGNQRAIEVMKQVYKAIDAPLIVTDVKIAELMKYVNNAFHATKIVFANEVGNICKKLNIDSQRLMEIFCQDKKLNISPYYMKPGFAYGGSCLPKDLKALKTIAHDYYLESPLLENIDNSNENQKRIVLEQIMQFGFRKIGFLGLSFKAGTDDLRNSPILDIIERLLGKGYDIKIFDRNVHFSQLLGANKEYILKKIPFISNFVTNNHKEVIDHSEVIVIVNKDAEFHTILGKMNKNDKIIYDLVNMDLPNKSTLKNYNGIAW
jgi:GDP-mannose 6-dehydrogenase